MSSDGGANAVAGIFGAGGALMEGADKAQAYDDHAAQLEFNAGMEKRIGEFNIRRQQIVANKKFGSIEAGYAASGLAQDSGSAQAVMTASHVNSEMDRLSIQHGTDMRVHGLEERAAYARDAADRARQMSYFNAFASLFGGAAKSYGGGGPDMDDEIETSSPGTSYGSAGGSNGDFGNYA